MNYKCKNIVASLFVLATFNVNAESTEDLAKKSQNPVGNIISVPIEYWHYDGMAGGASEDALMLKPVYPARIGNGG